MAIISFKHKFIFLKTRKVAGTSVEAVLRKITGENDIVPGVTPRDEYYSAKQGDYSKNYLANEEDEKKYTELVLREDFSGASEFLKGVRKLATSHMSYDRIKNTVKRNGFNIDDFYVFTIDRHPYSWLISQCLYSNEKYNSGKLEVSSIGKEEINRRVLAFLKRDDVLDRINWSMYADEQGVLVDNVLKYEELSQTLNKTLQRIGVDIAFDLPELKSNAKHIDSFSMLNGDVKEEAFKVFEKVFDQLGYLR